ncbi:hypothetical protein FSP39_009735 [Pinctada imbricata]|uniref:ATP-dependent DNA helicase n=1 Tax=Pinctada imbricata TaxID=66713 RepID=A0AA88YDK2_PINIB|nr:hypothetical protein FSP39_009735 [Pinctada imbricata]
MCPMNIGIQGKLWLCKTCYNYFRRGKMPPMSIMNKMEFPASCILQELNPLEQTLLAVILPFMKIHQAPRGKQKKLLGNMVLVPSDVDSTVTQLPRLQSNTGTIKAKLKRRLRYKHHVYALNIRPHLVRSAAKYLTSAPLYKQYVQFDDSWSEEIVDDDSSEEEDNEQHTSSDKQGTKDKVEGSDDEWDEVDEGEKMSGEADTMLTAPDYIEPGERDKVYNFAPAEGGAPLSVFLQPDCEELAFPGIFCGHKRPSNEDRTVRVTYGDIVKSELRNADRRAASNIENLFFKTKKIQMKTLIDQGQLALRKVKIQDQQLTVKDVTGEAVQSLIFHDKAYKFLANIRGSPPYFEKASKDLFAMIRQLEPATFFITLSAAESRWLHLLRILGTVVDHRKYTDQELEDMTWDEKCRLIQSDPITCARVFDHSVSAFLSTFIHSECHPLSEVQDFFYRVEYQQRGSPHIHMMVWCKDSPTFGKDSDEEVCEFIDKFITCNSITDKTNLTELIGLQNHRHSHTCKKKREKVCRFGFPKPPLEKTTILYPLEEDIPRKVKEELRKKYKCIQTFLNEHENDLDISYKDFLDLLKMTEEEYVKAIRSTLKSPTVFLKRKVCEPRMNNYNENILLAWRANIDIQFVLDVYACATYVASYVTKSQRGMSELLRQASKEVQSGNLNLKEQIRTVGNKFLNAVEISAQEAAYICLQLPMKRASRKVVFVNTSPPSARVSLLKPQGILNKMKEDDDDIECSNDLTRYATRPTSMENMCLAEFISQYDRISKDDKQIQVSLAKTMNLRESSEINNDDEDKNTDLEEEAVTTSLDQQYRKRKIGNILRPVHFNPDTDTELYYRELIVLYHPWRDEDALKDENESFQQKYITLRDEISKQREIYEPFAAAVDEASRLILESDDIDETWDQLAPQAEHAESEDRHNTEKPVDAGIEDYDIGQDVGLPISNVEEDLHSYNEMSDEDYRNHMQKLNRTQIAFVYDIVHHLKSSNEPIYRFLSGGAGVGKSYVTSALYQTALKYLNKKEGDNFTARKLLLLAPTGKAAYHIKGTTIHCGSKIPPNQKLEHKPLSASSLNSLRNEIGSVSLVFIDEISMVGFKMMNCIHQRLMEIKQSPKPFGGVSIIAVGDLFQLKPVMDSYIFSSPKSGYLPLATNLWTDLFSMVELTQIMRQADHKNFAELLNRLREGNQTQQDIDTLKERQLSIPQTDIHYPSTSVHLYATNERVNAFNSTVILRTDTPKSLVTAKDRLVGSTPPSMQQKILQNFKNSSQTKQLSNTVELAEGVIYDLNFHDENIGRALRNSSKHLYRGNVNRNWTPIEPIVKQCTAGHKGQAQIQRLQYPLRPAHAKTIHRSQGDTMDSAVIDMTTKRKIEHIHYVAVSRLKSLDGLHIINLEENKIAVSTDVQREMERLRSIPQQTSSTLSLSSNEGNLKIVYLNARSLHRHLPDIKCDININVSDVAIFSETRLCERDSQDATSLTSHPYQYRFDGSCAGDNRPYHGLNIYSKQELIVIDQSKRNNIEIVLAETNMGISVIAVYKPPTVSSTALCKNLKELHTKHLFHESLILGDFNIDWNEDSSQRKQLKKCLCDDLGYKQNIEGPTTDRQTRIDLIFSRLLQPITTGTAEVYFSDHKIVWASC